MKRIKKIAYLNNPTWNLIWWRTVKLACRNNPQYISIWYRIKKDNKSICTFNVILGCTLSCKWPSKKMKQKQRDFNKEYSQKFPILHEFLRRTKQRKKVWESKISHIRNHPTWQFISKRFTWENQVKFEFRITHVTSDLESNRSDHKVQSTFGFIRPVLE